MATLYSPKIVTDGLILTLDAINPKSYPGTGTVWKDLSGNGYNFNLINGPTPTSEGLAFDGTNQYANIGSSGLNFSTANSRTIEIWVKVVSLPAIQGGLFGDQASTSAVILVDATGKFNFRWDDSSSVLSNFTITTGKWVQFVLVHRPERYITYYVNGELDTPEFQTSDTGVSPNSAWSIGRQNRNFTGEFYYLNCVVSTARQYNRQLTATEIYQNYNAMKSRYGL
jgi:O-acetyl-ADP-ribose deacetylase (regulator of RNase III)